jgi:hypothetical protein
MGLWIFRALATLKNPFSRKEWNHKWQMYFIDRAIVVSKLCWDYSYKYSCGISLWPTAESLGNLCYIAVSLSSYLSETAMPLGASILIYIINVTVTRTFLAYLSGVCVGLRDMHVTVELWNTVEQHAKLYDVMGIMRERNARRGLNLLELMASNFDMAICLTPIS